VHDVTIGVATFGSQQWANLANSRALPSAFKQPANVLRYHDRTGTLATSRNQILDRCDTEYLIYLDADDRLEPGYVQAMTRGSADVRVPYCRRFMGLKPYLPIVWAHQRFKNHTCEAACLPDGNWIVIGACVRTQVLKDAGGWLEEPIYEDWSMWLRCHVTGASFEPIPEAVYNNYWTERSRSTRQPSREANETFLKIYEQALGRPWNGWHLQPRKEAC